jgi:hypothetical protein
MTAGYMVATGIGGATLFFVLLWAFSGNAADETPWVSAGLAAIVVVVLALGGKEMVGRRPVGTKSVHTDRHEAVPFEKANHRSPGGTVVRNSAALRILQKQSSDADVGNSPEAHLEAFHACSDYLESTEELIRVGEISRESRAALRSGQERIRALQKHHMLTWASSSSRLITQDAQLKLRLSDKVETALRGLTVIRSAQEHYPNEPELAASATAINEFIASAKVAHWVELAERSAFKGHYRRAIERYKDALFYLSRENVRDEQRGEISERIGREIDLLRVRIRTRGDFDNERQVPRKERASGL